jgi:general secretion pathway protein C
MDVATHILQWKEHPPEEWARAANRYLPHIVSALLILALANKLAEMTWAVIPGTPPSAPAPVVSGSTSRAAPVTPDLNFASISASHLFGEASATPAPVAQSVVDAPDTNLNLELRGIMSTKDSESGWAIIADSRSQERTYFIGDPIEGSGGTVLHAVYGDRVILNRSGNLETLRLPKDISANAVTMTSQAGAALPTVAPASLQDVISQNASRITDIIRVAPQIEQGQMVGFRINPGQARDQFDALGLQPGDVVTDINGTAMTDPSRGLEVFEALGEATVANVTIVRNGQPEVLAIDTSQLAGLAEGRQ